MAYTATEVSEMLGINRVTIYRHIRDGKLPARKVGERSYRITQEDIDTFLANMAQEEKVRTHT
jgi:excisionase family DNA binding protein